MTYTASIGDIGESSDISSPGILSHVSGLLVYYHLALVYHHLPILALMEKLKRQRIENLFINVGVVYLPGDINGLAKKLHE